MAKFPFYLFNVPFYARIQNNKGVRMPKRSESKEFDPYSFLQPDAYRSDFFDAAGCFNNDLSACRTELQHENVSQFCDDQVGSEFERNPSSHIDHSEESSDFEDAIKPESTLPHFDGEAPVSPRFIGMLRKHSIHIATEIEAKNNFLSVQIDQYLKGCIPICLSENVCIGLQVNYAVMATISGLINNAFSFIEVPSWWSRNAHQFYQEIVWITLNDVLEKILDLSGSTRLYLPPYLGNIKIAQQILENDMAQQPPCAHCYSNLSFGLLFVRGIGPVLKPIPQQQPERQISYILNP